VDISGLGALAWRSPAQAGGDPARRGTLATAGERSNAPRELENIRRDGVKG